MEALVKLLSPEQKSISVQELPIYKNKSYELKPFDELTLAFFDHFSKKIMADNSINRLPEIAALGFWIRKSNLSKMQQDMAHLFNTKSFVTSPIGKVLHICPANVDTMFIYSFAVSLLMGNKNVLRVSNRMNAPHIDTLFVHLNGILQTKKYSLFRNYINIITYDHNDETSTYLSQQSNVRVIWGGDNTVKTFKSFKAAPRTKDIVFADRVSMLCIQCDTYLNLDEQGKNNFAKLFFNDAYTFDQMGCSSPQTIYFLGNDKLYRDCMDALLVHLQNYISSQYKSDISSLASLKLNRVADDAFEDVITKKTGNNYLMFAEQKKDHSKDMLHSCGGGYFYTAHVNSLSELDQLKNPKVQTLSYFGLNEKELNELTQMANGEGIDRIVPLGQALNFDYIWDGYNLFEELSKKIKVI
jgi:hypothetical protein